MTTTTPLVPRHWLPLPPSLSAVSPTATTGIARVLVPTLLPLPPMLITPTLLALPSLSLPHPLSLLAVSLMVTTGTAMVPRLLHLAALRLLQPAVLLPPAAIQLQSPTMLRVCRWSPSSVWWPLLFWPCKLELQQNRDGLGMFVSSPGLKQWRIERHV